ncbi:MAG: GyrI-like domain-containing protein [Planctomycetes bacterium]|nr:GyrI-like domain-containing protein [Planctomycetota bacterium]
MRTATKPRHSTTLAYIDRVNRAIDYVMPRLDRPLRLTAVARAACLSPFHFHRVFQIIMGETLADFVKRQRLDHALKLMAREKPPSLTRVALACGFTSSSDFSRSFKQRFGIAPRAFDLDAWRDRHRSKLEASMPRATRLPPRANPDRFSVRIRELPARTVAYIRVNNPYKGDAPVRAVERLMAWAEPRGFSGNQWLGYQWENPELVPLEHCRYHAAVEASNFTPSGEIGCYRFPAMLVAQVEVKGDIHLELRALQWLYGSWLPRSGYVPADQPAFEAWIGKPFAHGYERFELHAQLPIKRA